MIDYLAAILLFLAFIFLEKITRNLQEYAVKMGCIISTAGIGEYLRKGCKS